MKANIDRFVPLYSAKVRGCYTYTHILTFYKKMSLSYTPWDLLNIVTLTRIEFSHLHFGHNVPVLSEQVLKSNPMYTNAKMKPMISQAWNTITNNQYRPSYIRNTYISHSASKKSLALKAVNVYAAGFELGVHGITLGFDETLTKILRDVNQWIGKCFSDTIDSHEIEELKLECLQLIHRIQQSPTLFESFNESQTLTMWRDMCLINWFWLPIPSMYMTLKFETQNKKQLFQIHESQNWCHKTMLSNAVERNRLLKNAEFFQSGMEIPDEPIKYGTDILKNADPNILFSNPILQCTFTYCP